MEWCGGVGVGREDRNVVVAVVVVDVKNCIWVVVGVLWGKQLKSVVGGACGENTIEI